MTRINHLSTPPRSLRALGAACVFATAVTACGSSTKAATTTTANAGGATATTAAAGSTSAAAAPKKAYRLAGTAGLANDAFWISLMCGGTAAAKAAGATIEWKTVAKAGDSQTEQANMDAAVVAKPDGIVFSPYQTPFAPGFIKGIMDKGIPVAIVNAKSESTSDYYVSVTSGAADANVKAMGDLIVKDSGGSGKVLVLGGLPNIPVLEARWQPARDVVQAANPALKFLDPQYEKFDVNTATQIVSAAIVANPDLKAVYTTSGPSGEGATTAIEQAGKKGQIRVYSFDATPPIVQGVKDGTVAALLAQPARLMGQRGVEKLIEYLGKATAGAPVAPASPIDQPIETKLLTKDNIDSPEAQGYQYKATCDA